MTPPFSTVSKSCDPPSVSTPFPPPPPPANFRQVPNDFFSSKKLAYVSYSEIRE